MGGTLASKCVGPNGAPFGGRPSPLLVEEGGYVVRFLAPRTPLPRDVRGPVFADPNLNRRDKMTLLWGRKALRPGVRSRLGKFRE